MCCIRRLRRRRRLTERTGSPTSLNPETEWPAEEFTQLKALVIRNKSVLEIDKLPVAALSFEKNLYGL